jgi:uncharacterized protein
MGIFSYTAPRLVTCARVLLVIWATACADTTRPGVTLATQQKETRCDTIESEKKLFDAIARGDLKGVESLLADGVSPYALIEISDDGEKTCSSALMQAFRQGQTEIVKLLFNAFDRTPPNKWIDLPYIGFKFRTEKDIIEDLVVRGKDVNTPKDSRDTPLVRAASVGSADLTRFLIENGADVKRYGNAAIMGAVDYLDSRNFRGRVKIIRMLARAGADVNATDGGGNTALIRATHKTTFYGVGDRRIIKELLSLGADVNSSNGYGDTALIEAVRNPNLSNYRDATVDTINILVSAGANIHAENRVGETALTIPLTMYRDYDLDILEALLAHNVGINEIGSTMEPPLIFAIRSAAGRSNGDMVRALIKAGADVNAGDSAGTPALIVTVRDSGNAEVVRLLLGAGARVNAKDRQGDTALIAAVREFLPGGKVAVKEALRRNPEVIRALLDAGADVSVKDERGHTASDLAKRAGNKDIIQLLSGAQSIRK